MEQGEARLLPECREDVRECRTFLLLCSFSFLCAHHLRCVHVLATRWKELERVLGVPLKRRRKSRLDAPLHVGFVVRTVEFVQVGWCVCMCKMQSMPQERTP